MQAEPTAPVEMLPPQARPAPVPETDGLKQKKRPRDRRWIWLLPLALLPLGAVALPQLLTSAPVETAQAQALPVQTVRLTPVDRYETQRTYTGEVVARRSSDLGFEGAGTLTKLLVDDGDSVTAGQPLAHLDTRSLEAQQQQILAQKDQAVAQLRELETGPRKESIAAAQAAVADLEQQVALAQIQRQRRQELYSRGAISLEELDQQSFGTGSLENRLQQAQSQLNELLAGSRREQVDAQTARVRQLDASLQAINVDLSKSVLRAPFSGTVSQRLVDEGTVVSASQTVLKLIEGNMLEGRIGVPTQVADTLSVGSSQTVQVGSISLPATVTALLPELDPTSRTVTVVLAIRAETAVTVGQTARLVITETQASEGFWLPSSALVPGERGLWSVYVAASQPDGDGFEVARRDVELLHTEGDRILNRGMVQPGEEVIAAGANRVVPGQAISITR
ncbi:MAG: efflux RND transporter periplasmic adaptor subunit [Cyanobacteria bacterium Co-bin13]|nr:efflux RND transporter periplasmic adaptor subunit [Cyanobacteria bacterium Co-bin13]